MKEIIEKEELNNIVNTIKSKIKNTLIKTMIYANKNLIMMYFRIGKVLSENSKYGNSFIKNISHSIRLEYPGIKGFSESTLISTLPIKLITAIFLPLHS